MVDTKDGLCLGTVALGVRSVQVTSSARPTCSYLGFGSLCRRTVSGWPN